MDKIDLKSDAAFTFILDEIDAVIYVIDVETHKILYANKHCIKDFGNIVGKICYSVLEKNRNIPCEDCDLSNNSYPKALSSTYKWEHFNTSNNKHYIFSTKIIELKNRKVKIQAGINISKQKYLERQVADQNAKSLKILEALSQSTIEGLIILDENKKCIKANAIAPELLGYTEAEMINKSIFEFIAPESIVDVKKFVNNEDQLPYETMLLRKDATTFPALVRGKNIQLADKKIRVSAIMDITKMKEKEKEISKLAYYDPLTSLPNRALLQDRANRLISKISRNKNYAALMFVDLDNFKNINDTKGHMVGDLILKEYANNLSKTMRKYDTLARFGGDEFVVLIDTHCIEKDLAIKSIKAIASNILRRISRPLTLEKNEYQLSASIGITIFNDVTTLDELMKQADSAMYYSKNKGKNNYSFFDPELQKEIERKTSISEKLRKAINKQEIKIHYQKQLNQDKEVVGVEALLRWTDKTFGYISPIEFIAIAEESSLIFELGAYVIEESIKLISRWEQDEIKNNWRISVNISIKQFDNDDFIEKIESNINKYNINPNKLRLEFTESLLLKDTDKVLEKINYLRALGLTFSIDDFGTGYSSLSYLKKLPIDELKIDKSFIDDLLIDENDEAIVLTILSLGSKFGFTIIAEGVETKETYEKLLSLGCNYFQGYYFAKPCAEKEL
ncbi:EAL domain-containing protein [uncultured Desulfuromonas sp.]|uniref:EAL domain-containing protein n=1 Tax=uncultured Desulfuromonas sp. TaxID=181013 RepID=UPI002AAC0E31|nr:EAL domain-containing protein [uncultured Desulfuromonas sp.]